MRGGRAFIVLTVYLLLLAITISVIFLTLSASQNSFTTLGLFQVLGKSVFGMVIGIELFTVALIAPALSAGAISSERERQTFDLLKTTILPARSVVSGKLLSSLSYIFLLLLTALPLQTIAYLLGGVLPEEILIGNLLLVITAITYSTIGLFFSSFTRRTLVSTVLSYAFSLLLLFGLPIFILTMAIIFNSVLFTMNFPTNILAQTLLLLTGWFFVSLNPVLTAAVTELILIQGQSALYFAFPLESGRTVPILSPWISFAIIYILLSLLLIGFSIHFVKKVEK